MRVSFKIVTAIGCCLGILLFGPGDLFAADVSASPKIKVVWKQLFSQGTVEMSVTNNGKTAVKVMDELVIYARSEDERFEDPMYGDHKFKLFDAIPDVIYPVLHFVYPSDNSKYPIADASIQKEIPPDDAIEIKPGETKTFSMRVDGRIQAASRLDEAHLLLRLNGKDIDKVVLKKTDGIWK